MTESSEETKLNFYAPVANAAVKVEGGQKAIQHNYALEQKHNLAEAAVEIQQLLRQLEQTYPTTTPDEKQIVVAEAIERIESNPTLKARVVGALKAGGTEAFKELVDHPLVNILIATLEGWRDVSKS